MHIPHIPSRPGEQPNASVPRGKDWPRWEAFWFAALGQVEVLFLGNPPSRQRGQSHCLIAVLTLPHWLLVGKSLTLGLDSPPSGFQRPLQRESPIGSRHLSIRVACARTELLETRLPTKVSTWGDEMLFLIILYSIYFSMDLHAMLCFVILFYFSVSREVRGYQSFHKGLAEPLKTEKQAPYRVINISQEPNCR